MDPNANLDELRRLVRRKLYDDNLTPAEDARLAELVERGPWYYAENSLYWLHRHLRHIVVLPAPVERWLVSTHDYEKAEDAKALDHFKSTIVFGALSDDAIPPLP